MVGFDKMESFLIDATTLEKFEAECRLRKLTKSVVHRTLVSFFLYDEALRERVLSEVKK